MTKVLYVDWAGLLGTGKLLLEERGLTADTAGSAEKAIEHVKTEKYDAVIFDYQMLPTTGIEFLKCLNNFPKPPPIIMFTGGSIEGLVLEALENGGVLYVYVRKKGEPDAQFDELARKVKQVVAKRRSEESLVLLRKATRHDIINHLHVLLGYTALLKSERDPDEVKKYLTEIEKAAFRIKSCMATAAIYQDVGVREPEWLSVREVVAECSTSTNLTLKAEVGDLKICTDPVLFKSVLNILADNTERHGMRATEVKITQLSGEKIVLVYEDNGVGIESEIKERIFDQGFGKNTGQGLWLAREMLRLVGMTITETGVPGKGARFEISMDKETCRME